MTTLKYRALYPRMWAAPGEKCLHRQRRRGLIALFCARPKDHTGVNHLHDVHPDMQTKEVSA